MHVPHIPLIRTALVAALAWTGMPGTLEAKEEIELTPVRSNPISKLARLISPKLVKVEERVAWLDREVASLAPYNEFPLHYNLGYRGHRPTPASPSPTITLDLGKTTKVDQVFLLPSQWEYQTDSGIFPKRFTIELADQADFSDAQVIHHCKKVFPKPNSINPVGFTSKFSGRYLRLIVHQGHNKSAIDLFGLSELLVLSDGNPVSFNAKVSTVGDLNIDKVWHPQALIDGRFPLGIWHQGQTVYQQHGDAVKMSKEESTVSWSAEFKEDNPIDHVILFPFQLHGSNEISIMPQSLKVELTQSGDTEPSTAYEWSNPIPGSNQLTPLIIPLHGKQAQTVTISAIEPWTMGKRRMNALSEIQIWSNGENLILNKNMTRHQNGKDMEVRTLSDGFSSQRSIAPLDEWLGELIQREQIERELASLRSVYGQLSTRSELNVSWGVAVVLGLTFLFPVFIFERKRMRTKEQLDLMRKRIAADLHDDIGSNLGSISLIARTARKDLARLNGPEEVDKDLGEVETIARESSLAMRDIVWLLERKRDSIGDLVHRMRETAGRLLRGTDFTLECTSTKTAAKLTLNAKRHLFLFYKEAIHNILKHSKADKISIRLWDEGEQLGMEIIDNGIGLPVNGDRVSVSVKKLEERSEVLGGNLDIESSAETGTSIRLLVKRAKLTTPSRSS